LDELRRLDADRPVAPAAMHPWPRRLRSVPTARSSDVGANEDNSKPD
jgi:hypothetical protein